ncbi:hypothetical protein MKW98_007128 [Papaver atlanticum]|uniref:Uncharacterized protein n=1 Tax=Papaver atlanticum TaxID=357466 RepID=A0AAD4SNY4_9MAGN|nr:hypothetical protein MKW98_007128 [Papaver atlanticum]
MLKVKLMEVVAQSRVEVRRRVGGQCQSYVLLPRGAVQSTGFDQLMRECQDMIATWKKQKVNPVPEEEWMAVLKGMPDLDENLKLDAVDFLRGDSVDAQFFLALTAELQKKWLIRKLRPNLL